MSTSPIVLNTAHVKGLKPLGIGVVVQWYAFHAARSGVTPTRKEIKNLLQNQRRAPRAHGAHGRRSRIRSAQRRRLGTPSSHAHRPPAAATHPATKIFLTADTSTVSKYYTQKLFLRAS